MGGGESKNFIWERGDYFFFFLYKSKRVLAFVLLLFSELFNDRELLHIDLVILAFTRD